MSAAGNGLSLRVMTWRTLHRQLVRTSLSALGVSVGVIAIVALGAVAKGLRQSIQAGIKTGGSDLMIWQAGVAADIFSSLDEADARKKLADFPEIDALAAGMSHLVRIPGQRSVAALQIIIGIYPGEFGQEQQEILSGRNLERRDEVIVGFRYAKFKKKRVGDSVEIGGKSFPIAGIFRTGVIYFDGAIVMHIDEVRALNGRPGQVTSFNVRVKPGVDVDALGERIEAKYPEFATISDESEYHKIDQGLDATDDMVWIVSFIALVVGSLVIANTMWMSVAQRTREIGVLRAVGWSRRRIIGLILSEAFGIGIVGCIAGFAMGVGLAELTRELPFSRQIIDPVYPPSIFLRALAVAVLLSVVGAMIPAIRAARISPVEAFRYE